MSWNNTVNVNPNISCEPGLCLVYVRETFGVAAKYGTASLGWQGVALRHTDQSFPGVYVPVWFAVSNNPNGHVALLAPDGSVYSASSATSQTPIHHASISALNAYYGNRLTYLGWSEDINGVTIATYTANPTPGGLATVTGATGANVRLEPTTAAALAGSRWLGKGATFDYSGIVQGQTVSGNSNWVRSTLGHYVWAGNTNV